MPYTLVPTPSPVPELLLPPEIWPHLSFHPFLSSCPCDFGGLHLGFAEIRNHIHYNPGPSLPGMKLGCLLARKGCVEKMQYYWDVGFYLGAQILANDLTQVALLCGVGTGRQKELP